MTRPATNTVVSWLAAGAFLIMYFVVAGLLLSRFGFADESGAKENWERALTIFNGLSAIGFAAAGALLGTTVQQVNVSNAQKSENKMADRSKELLDAVKKKLSTTMGTTEVQALWSGHITGGSIDTDLHKAIEGVNELLRERVS